MLCDDLPTDGHQLLGVAKPFPSFHRAPVKRAAAQRKPTRIELWRSLKSAGFAVLFLLIGRLWLRVATAREHTFAQHIGEVEEADDPMRWGHRQGNLVPASKLEHAKPSRSPALLFSIEGNLFCVNRLT